MALTEFQRDVCRRLAQNRIAAGEAYLAGGATLNELIATPRISRDVDLFHDSEEALAATWDADRRLLEASRFSVTVLRERPVFVEARVAQGDESVLLQWVRDSAYRFFSTSRARGARTRAPSVRTLRQTRSLLWWVVWKSVTGSMSSSATPRFNPWATSRGQHAARILASARRQFWNTPDDRRAILQKRPWSCPLTAFRRSWRTIEEMASLAGIRRESDRASSCRGGWQMRSHTERCPLSRRRLRASGGSASRRDCIPRGMYSRCLSASPRRRVVRASSWQDLESQKYVSLALQTVSADTPQKVGRHVVVGERRDHHRSVAYDDPQS